MLNENSLSCEKHMHLPPEVLSEILSWLDVDSLLRFKTVCKEWFSLIEDHTFIRSHMMKSRGRWVFDMVMDSHPPTYNRYQFADSYFGLILEHNHFTQYYWLTNPSTRKTLELPHPGSRSVPRDTKMRHIHSSDALKLVFPCPYEVSQSNGRAVFKVLTVGIDNAWRDIDIPFPEFSSIYLIDTTLVGEACFTLRYSSTCGLEVICLEMGNEQVSRIKVPNSFFSFPFIGVVPLAWGESLALGRVIREEDEVHVWVLEDHKKNRWAEKKIIIPLKFLGPRCSGMMGIHNFHDNGLLMIYDFKECLLLDVVTGSIRWSHHAFEGQLFTAYYHVPSLQHPKGDETRN